MEPSARRLIHLALWDHPREGSFIPMLLAILSAAKEEGWEAEAVFAAPAAEPPPWVDHFTAAGLPVRFAPPGSRLQLGRWLGRVLAESDAATALHTHFTIFDIPAVLAARRRHHTAVIWHDHTALQSGAAMRARYAVKYTILGRRADRILCAAPDLAETVRRFGGGSRKVIFFPNAIDLDRFPIPTAAERADARRMRDLPEDRQVLLHFGWSWEVKGSQIYLPALRSLHEGGRKQVLGLEISEDPAPEEMRQALGLGDDAVRVIALQEDVRALYAAADLFIASSLAEGGTPYSFLEALASGLPVVATDIPGHRYIAERVEGCTLCRYDAEDLADVIRVALEKGVPLDPSVAARARNGLVEHFDLRDWCRRLLDLYQEVLPESGQRR